MARYADLQTQEEAWLAKATEADLGRMLRVPLIPNGECIGGPGPDAGLPAFPRPPRAVRQDAKRHGGTPPQSDFIV